MPHSLFGATAAIALPANTGVGNVQDAMREDSFLQGPSARRQDVFGLLGERLHPEAVLASVEAARIP